MNQERLLTLLSACAGAKRGRQHELAQAIGVTDEQVSNWINRKKTPSLRHGLAVLEFLRRRAKL
jgi:transcriptional regulator with XRE-family HTH domain